MSESHENSKVNEKPEEEESEKSKTKTLKEQGAVLPLGTSGGSGSFIKDIAVRPWRMKEEKILGKIRDENRNSNMAEYISMILATMCTKIGGNSFPEIATEKKDMAERRVIIGQMFMGDIWYAYLWLRVKSIGNILEIDIVCPTCKKDFRYKADLETVEVISADTLEDAKWNYKLRDPFDIRGKKAETLILGPIRWSSLEMMGGFLNEYDLGIAKSGAIVGSIHGIVGRDENISLVENELDEMSKYDIEHITNEISEKSIGPDMSIEGECEKCRRKFRATIDWRFDNFFGVSSLSQS